MKNQGLLDSNKDYVISLLHNGVLKTEIGRKLGTTGSAVSAFVKRVGVEPYTKVCKVEGCNKVFTTYDARKIYCSDKCNKKQMMRRFNNVEIKTKTCALSEYGECVETFIVGSKSRKKFCCKNHAGRYEYLQYKEALKESRFKCEVCGETLVVDLHHIIPRSEGGLDDYNNITSLCPNHHTAIHRGLAIIIGKTYVLKGVEYPIRSLRDIIGDEKPEWFERWLHLNWKINKIYNKD